MYQILQAIEKCPFLQQVKEDLGQDYTQKFVQTCPFKQQLKQPSGLTQELNQLEGYSQSYESYHGKHGVYPLRKGQHSTGIQLGSIDSCAPEQKQQYSGVEIIKGQQVSINNKVNSHSEINNFQSATNNYEQLAYGSISLSLMNLWNPFGDGKDKKNKQQKKPNNSKGPNNNRGTQGNGGKTGNSKTSLRNNHKISAVSRNVSINNRRQVNIGGQFEEGRCPLRKFLGPSLSALILEGRITRCPQLIVQARAVLARTELARFLRPQQVYVKLFAVGVITALTNVPFGALRENFRKFSPEWFIAIHATIPFVAMLRKAIIMPKYSLAVTLLSAVAGQVVGSRIKRRVNQKRLEYQSVPNNKLTKQQKNESQKQYYQQYIESLA